MPRTWLTRMVCMCINYSRQKIDNVFMKYKVADDETGVQMVGVTVDTWRTLKGHTQIAHDRGNTHSVIQSC